MEKDPILKAATTILTLSDWPENRNQLAVFGNEEIALLLKVTVTKASNKHEIVRSSSCIFKLNTFSTFKISRTKNSTYKKL
jgi:hypothetical protein